MEKDNVYSLTNSQKAIWYTEQYYKGSSVNTICGTIIVNEKVNIENMKKAMIYFAKNNKSFGLKFHVENGEPKQNLDFKEPRINEIEIKSHKELEEKMDEIAKTPFKVEDNDLYEFYIFKMPNEKCAMMLKMHHLIADAWTFGLSSNEVMDTYYNLEHNLPLKDYNEFSYIDFINSEKEYVSSAKMLKDKEYWNNVYSTIPDIAKIPGSVEKTDALKTCNAQRKVFKMEKSQVEAISEYCKQNKCSLFNFFMAVYGIYIGKICNLSSFVIGTPILNRRNFKEKNSTGMYVSTMPFRMDINEGETFTTFIEKISKDSFDMLKHQRYSYQTILEDLRTKNSNIPQLYHHLLSYQITNAKNNNSNIDYYTEWPFNGYCANPLEIHIHDMDDTGELNICYDYQESVYSARDIEKIYNHIVNIINQIIENPKEEIKNINILTEEEQNKILYEFNNTKVDFPVEKNVSTLFEEQVKKTPNEVAVCFKDETITFKELNEKANSLAFYLRQQGVGRNTIVGIMENRSIEVVVSMFAVMKAGGAYIPIDPTYPKERIDYMLETSESKILLTQKKLADKVDFKNKVFVDLTEDNKIYNNPKNNIKSINKPDDVAYIIFTSGSTGKPKGVMVKHRGLSNFANFCDHYISYLKNPENQTMLSITTISFDLFELDSVVTLQRGVKLVIADDNEKTSPISLNELIKKHNVTALQTTPSIVQIFLNNIKEMPALKDLKCIIMAGEQLPLSLVNSLKKLSKDMCIFNGYGPSETTVYSTCKDLTNEDEVTIGRPLDNNQIYILDENLKPVPIGIVGEIYISGFGVGKGYLNRPDLTEKSFIKNPFLPDSIMYKSGDLGYFDESGNIYCKGRADHQVKIRGQRVELGEIEDRIAELPYIKTCVVAKKIDANGHEYLCAYYTSNEQCDSNEIRTHLQNFLPRYMVPQYFIQMEKLPYTPNGKINRKALPDLDYKSENRDIVRPRNETDKKLEKMFKKVLNIENVSIKDSFFDLGGDSLSAINLCVEIQSEFNTQLFVKDILEHSTIEEISDIISNNKDKATVDKIEKVKKAEYYPASNAQKRIYLASQAMGSNAVTYNIAGGVILDGKIDAKKLEDSFKQLINRQESLRTSFEVHNGDVVQKIHDNIDFKVDVVDRQNIEIESELPGETNLNSSNNNQNDLTFVKPFDLSKAPLIRAKLVKFANDKSVLLVDIHHIVCDGTSLSIIIDEICKLYNGESLPELSISYKDFAVYENNNLKNGKLKQAEEYWTNKFKGEIPVLNMPTNYQRPAVQSFEGKKVYTKIDKEKTEKLEKLAKKLGVTPYMIMLSCYYILLSKYTSQDDIVVGTPVVGRNNAETSNLVGMFVNTLALREKIDSNLSCKEFILAIKNNLLEAYKYQTYPFNELVSKLNLKRDESRNPLFDTMFIYQSNIFRDIKFNGIKASYYMPDFNISKFDLTVEAIPKDGEIDLSFEYATKLFKKDFIEDLSDCYLNILDTILTNTDEHITEVQLLTEQKQNEILSKINDTKLDVPENKRVIDLFDEQVKKTPDKIALVFHDEKYTYKELEEKVTKLSNHIKSLPVYKEICKDETKAIGIMMNRRAELLISMLAILKAGCCYLPIDPTYPEGRISYIIDNTSVKLMLTETILKDRFNKNDNSGFNIETVLVDTDEAYQVKESENLNKDNKIKGQISLLDNLETEKSALESESLMKPTDLAYLIYTSGSTGNPKGVMIKQSNVVNFIYSMNKITPIKGKTVVSITTMSFDIFVVESLLPVCSGLKVVFADNQEQNSPILLNELCKKNNVDFINTTPSKFNFLMSDAENLDYIRNMKLIFLSGEQLPSNILENVQKVAKDSEIYDMYGPTETTIFSTHKNLTNEKKVTIGKPISNTNVYVLDNNMNMVPINVPGKLYIGGKGVTKGYLNRPELTSERFIEYNGDYVYDTGDLAKININYELECLGRSDFQVKIRGLRIELGEIEKQMASYPGVQEAVVAQKNVNGRAILCGYFVARGRIPISLIRSAISKKLPNYMIPTYIVQINSFTHTPSGKIDRKVLPEPKIEKKQIVYPKTVLQREMVMIWKNILSIDEISIDDNFFDIGGDSLCALKLQLELMKHNINIEYGDIFKNNTIISLCDFIENINKDNKTPIYHKRDFRKANKALKTNVPRKLKIKEREMKNVLLAGATGFLGIHVLAELLKEDDIKIYCLIREDPSTSARNKLKNKFKYYFGSDLSNLFGNRIVIISGDITEKYFGNSEFLYNLLSTSVDTVINCAAIVKHFGKYEKFENVNVNGVKNLIAFCEEFNKKFIQISTTSVSGNTLMGMSVAFNPKKKVYFGENNLFVGQSLENVYVRSKFEAEKYMLEEIASKKLNGIILRVGNITNRYSDGKFQDNSSENAFLNRIKAFLYLKMVPKSIMKGYAEFSPVDKIAESIVKVIRFYTPTTTVLHLYNSNHLYLTDLIKILKELGVEIEIVDDEIFKTKLKNLLFNSPNFDKISVLLNDLDKDYNLVYKTNLSITNKYTLEFLNKIDFKWPEVTKEYIKKILENL